MNNPTKSDLTQVTIQEQQEMLPPCVIPSCKYRAPITVEQVYVTGESWKVALCITHAATYRAKQDG